MLVSSNWSSKASPPTCPELRGYVRGHGSSHHHQGAQSILKLRAVENNCLRSLLRNRKEQQCKNTEVYKISLGKKGHECTWNPETQTGRKKPSSTSFLLWAKNSPRLIIVLKIAGVATADILLFVFLAVLRGLQDFSFLDQGSNPCPLQWKRRALTTGPPGNSRADILLLTEHLTTPADWC